MTEPGEVPLERDHYWWLHPALRGREALAADAAGLPWRWVENPAVAAREAPQAVTGQGPFADFAKLLYKLNGYRPGPVRGWYVIVQPEAGRYAVGQLCVDPCVPVVLFEDRVFDDEDSARTAAAALKRAQPGLRHTR